VARADDRLPADAANSTGRRDRVAVLELLLPVRSLSRWQIGHRGSHRAMARAIANLTVMNESLKWRSGRDRERWTSLRPSGRGGKTPHTFSDDERVAAEGDRNMVMPATAKNRDGSSRFLATRACSPACSRKQHGEAPCPARDRRRLRQRV
jgi:hypothetical protein